MYNVEQSSFPRYVTVSSRPALSAGPSTIAIHHNSNMLR
jgi:hypothetical protein